ncbi:peptide chain release factor family protein [Leptospira bouyouniensis]|uniref:Peptide chain release factor-like protein n=1 Tax=Leptospira bouyouniensis TaxID=2484911 RepID=A0ABY2L6R9_9LEPT|nr:peptide chain release factor-like protein [Leptospira bouyouniensis]TGK52347.1 peptide chain release factor-like protein [Leptospira bouyouniensis]
MALTFPVSPEKNASLKKRMEVVGIRESDLKEQFVKASGKGGQNVNKLATAVVLLHIPSGKQVKCSIYRTQGLNRYKARDLLCLEMERELEPSKFESSIQKLRKKKQNKYNKALKKKLEKEKLEGNDPI